MPTTLDTITDLDLADLGPVENGPHAGRRMNTGGVSVPRPVRS